MNSPVSGSKTDFSETRSQVSDSLASVSSAVIHRRVRSWRSQWHLHSSCQQTRHQRLLRHGDASCPLSRPQLASAHHQHSWVSAVVTEAASSLFRFPPPLLTARGCCAAGSRLLDCLVCSGLSNVLVGWVADRCCLAAGSGNAQISHRAVNNPIEP